MAESTEGAAVLAMTSRDVLTEILRQGAREMLAQAIEEEVAEYLTERAAAVDAGGRRLMVRNGHMPVRKIQTGLGEIAVERRRVNDRRVDAEGNRCRFISKILSPYLRRPQSVEELIPWLYLKGISTGQMSEALTAFLGPQASGLSTTTL